MLLQQEVAVVVWAGGCGGVALPSIVRAVIIDQRSAVPIPLVVRPRRRTQTDVEELSAPVVMQFVIERGERPELFLLEAAELAIRNARRVGARNTVTDVAGEVVEPARRVVGVSDGVPRRVGLRQDVAG